MSTGGQRKNRGIQYQLISASLLCHTTRRRIETFLQCGDTREEVCNPILHSGGFLKNVSKDNRELQIVGKPCD